MKKSIEFFMIVTNRSIFITDYCVDSYKKVYNTLSGNYIIKLKIYLNCINISKYQKYINKWQQISYVEIVYSKLNIKDFEYRDGMYIAIPTGKTYKYPMEFEEAFDYGYANFESDYFISVDNDFEIFNPQFIREMLNILQRNDNLGLISTSKTNTCKYFDSYSNSTIFLQERNDTWFCIFKKESKVQGISCHPVDQYVNKDNKTIRFNFLNGNWYEYIENCKKEESIRSVWDGMAFLQDRIRKTFVSPIIAITDIFPEFENQFIHYGAFSQNISLNTPFKIWLYRKVAIRRKIGFYSIPEDLNFLVKKFYHIVFGLLFMKVFNERKIDNAKSLLD